MARIDNGALLTIGAGALFVERRLSTTDGIDTGTGPAVITITAGRNEKQPCQTAGLFYGNRLSMQTDAAVGNFGSSADRDG